jgi:hypothetical protein
MISTKTCLYLLLPLWSLSVVHGNDDDARQLLVQRMRELPDALSALNEDWSCAMKGAESYKDCVTEEDDSCMWCPFGTGAGACLSSGQGEAVNQLQFPHMQCSSVEKRQDADDEFWDHQMTCSVAGSDQHACLFSFCTWCVVNNPSFGICMSPEFMNALEELQPEDEPIRVGDVISCDTNVREGLEDIHNLFDPSCFLAGVVSPDTCTEAADSAGRSCVSMEMFGTWCMTETQQEFLEWMLLFVKDMGVELDKLGDFFDDSEFKDDKELDDKLRDFLDDSEAEDDEESEDGDGGEEEGDGSKAKGDGDNENGDEQEDEGEDEDAV